MDYQDRLAARLKILQPSATVELNEKAASLIKQGKDVIALAAGEPDFAPPACIVRETKKALTEGFTHYTASLGIAELRETIAQKLAEENGLTYDPKSEILVAPGAKQGILYTCLAFLDSGDEVLSPEPAWVSYRECVTLAGATYVPVPTRREDRYRITRELLERYVTPRTKMIFINTPWNPTGRVLSEAELADVAACAREHDLLVLSDEIYERLVYDGHRHFSLATLPGMRERTLTLNGYSKTYAMTGFRLGYVAAPAPVIRELNKIQQHSATCPTSFAQKGTAGSFKAAQPAVGRMIRRFVQRRKLVMEGLSNIPGLTLLAPEGTFYMWVDCSAVSGDSKAVSCRLLEDSLVAMTPGVAFGDAGEGCLRLSFAVGEETLQEACRRIRSAFTRWSQEGMRP